jgi:hypothetical protein
MSRYLNKEVNTLRESLMTCIKENKPMGKLTTNLILSMIWLHFLADREGKTKNANERRRIIHEFKKGKKTLEEGIRYVFEEAQRGTGKSAQSVQ